MSSGETPKEIPRHVTTWSISSKDGQGPLLNYGDLHEIMYRDIGMGNEYRKERIKHLTTLATGVFALTVTFHKDLVAGPIDGVGLSVLLVGWGCLLVSLFAGVVHLRKWEDFYLSYRDISNALWQHYVADDDAGRALAANRWHEAGKATKAHQKGYREWNQLQTGTLLAGMALLAISVGMSIATRPDATVPARAELGEPRAAQLP